VTRSSNDWKKSAPKIPIAGKKERPHFIVSAPSHGPLALASGYKFAEVQNPVSIGEDAHSNWWSNPQVY
jgi:hypothetical protein